jgi:hypothetical protein
MSISGDAKIMDVAEALSITALYPAEKEMSFIAL